MLGSTTLEGITFNKTPVFHYKNAASFQWYTFIANFNQVSYSSQMGKVEKNL